MTFFQKLGKIGLKFPPHNHSFPVITWNIKHHTTPSISPITSLLFSPLDVFQFNMTLLNHFPLNEIATSLHPLATTLETVFQNLSRNILKFMSISLHVKSHTLTKTVYQLDLGNLTIWTLSPWASLWTSCDRCVSSSTTLPTGIKKLEAQCKIIEKTKALQFSFIWVAAFETGQSIQAPVSIFRKTLIWGGSC